MEQAGAELDSIASGLEKAFPDSNTNKGCHITSLANEFGQHQENNYILACFIVACLVLLIAATNVANLLLSRAVARQREIAVRFALGATKARVVRQLITENMIMVLAAAGLSLLIGSWGRDLLQSMISEDTRTYLHNFGVVSLDGLGIAFTILMAIVVGIGTGLAPAFAGANLDLNTMLKEGGPNSSESRSRNRLRAFLASGQVALALALVVTTVLIVIGMRNYWDANPGFEIDHLLTMRIAIPEKEYSNARTLQFFDQSLEQVVTQPGVKSATASSGVPYQGVDEIDFRIAGQAEPRPGEIPRTVIYSVMPNYFETLKIPLTAGRVFNRQDGPDSPRRIIVNDVVARRRFPKGSPIGQKIHLGKALDECEIVGVVGSVSRNPGTPAETDEQMYVPLAQDLPRQAFITLRTHDEPLTLAKAVRSQLMVFDRNLPIYGVSTMDTYRSQQSSGFRIIIRVLIANGFYALLLAVVGIYAVVSYSVSRRMREMGIRSALGASRRQLVELVVGQGVRLAVPGLVFGVVLAMGLMRLMKSIIAELKNDDPLVYVGALLILAASVIVASIVPPWRAARVDPLPALRHE